MDINTFEATIASQLRTLNASTPQTIGRYSLKTENHFFDFVLTGPRGESALFSAPDTATGRTGFAQFVTGWTTSAFLMSTHVKSWKPVN